MVVAGVLYHLGVDMGAPFYGGYYESDWLSKQLRRWWDEAHLPHLQEKVSQAKRIRILTEWIQKREQAGAESVGMKHPLLSLCGDDLVKAWGEETKFIRCCRPLDESVESMRRGMGFYNNPELAAETLFAALDRFFAHRPCLEITFADMMKNPAGEIRRLIQFSKSPGRKPYGGGAPICGAGTTGQGGNGREKSARDQGPAPREFFQSNRSDGNLPGK